METTTISHFISSADNSLLPSLSISRFDHSSVRKDVSSPNGLSSLDAFVVLGVVNDPHRDFGHAPFANDRVVDRFASASIRIELDRETTSPTLFPPIGVVLPDSQRFAIADQFVHVDESIRHDEQNLVFTARRRSPCGTNDSVRTLLSHMQMSAKKCCEKSR